MKRKRRCDLEAYTRRKCACKARQEAAATREAATSLLQLGEPPDDPEASQILHTSTQTVLTGETIAQMLQRLEETKNELQRLEVESCALASRIRDTSSSKKILKMTT